MVNMSRIFELNCISHIVLRIMKTSTFTTKKRNNFKIMDFLAQLNQLPELPQKYFIVHAVKSEKSTSQGSNTFFSLGTIHNQTLFWGSRFPLVSAHCDDYQTYSKMWNDKGWLTLTRWSSQHLITSCLFFQHLF